jgi:hypothetical protein
LLKLRRALVRLLLLTARIRLLTAVRRWRTTVRTRRTIRTIIVRLISRSIAGVGISSAIGVAIVRIVATR